MGIIALKHAFNKEKLLELLPQFCQFLDKMPRNEASCLLEKTSIYLIEYLGKDFLKELNMTFVSIGQKYGFVSIGDYFRQQMAEKIEKRIDKERQQFEKKLEKRLGKERQQLEEKLEEQLGKERQQMAKQMAEKLANERDKLTDAAEEEKINTARKMVYDKKLTIEEATAYFNLTKEQILEK
jgi:hypothetical protein